MAVTETLRGFVHNALARDLPRAEIERVLGQAGWPRDQVASALGEYAEIEFAVPVPVPKPYLSAREAFLYLVLFSTLYVGAFNFGAILFQLIDMAFPNPEAPVAAELIRERIRESLSLLIVATPVFLYVAMLTGRETRDDPARRASKVRRWLTYLTLFVAGSVLFGDVTTLVHNLLAGDLTVRFLLKVATIGLIAGTIFGYYLRDLARDDSR